MKKFLAAAIAVLLLMLLPVSALAQEAEDPQESGILYRIPEMKIELRIPEMYHVATREIPGDDVFHQLSFIDWESMLQVEENGYGLIGMEGSGSMPSTMLIFSMFDNSMVNEPSFSTYSDAVLQQRAELMKTPDEIVTLTSTMTTEMGKFIVQVFPIQENYYTGRITYYCVEDNIAYQFMLDNYDGDVTEEQIALMQTIMESIHLIKDEA